MKSVLVIESDIKIINYNIQNDSKNYNDHNTNDNNDNDNSDNNDDHNSIYIDSTSSEL
jgi:hypothetical protein